MGESLINVTMAPNLQVVPVHHVVYEYVLLIVHIEYNNRVLIVSMLQYIIPNEE